MSENENFDKIGESLEFIKEVVIMNPPTKYVDRKRKVIDEKTGKLREDVYYLTANLFYAGGLHYSLQAKIVKEVKYYLAHNFASLPKLERMRVEVVYYSPKDNFDLDNKLYFWVKLFLDIIKTPSNKQIINSAKKRRAIPTVSKMKDDTVRYIDQINMKYKKGEHKLVFIIYGRRENEQKKMTL